MLQTLNREEKENWHKHLQKVAFAFNATVNKSTGFSPHYLMFGRSPRLPIDKIFGVEANEGDVKMQTSYARYVEEWTKSMNQAFEIAERHAVASANQNQKYYGKKVRDVEIGVGDKVLARNRERGGTGKLRNYWENVVYVVIGKEENIPVYTIRPEKGKGRIKLKRVHRNDIMRCDELLRDDAATPAKRNQKAQPAKPESHKLKDVADCWK